MKKIKVLNLYAGIGGNRKLWKNVDVTAVEIDEKIADIYKKEFPEDEVIVGDAHKFLLEHHKEFDFIWSSPPCPTHSVCNNFLYAQGVIRYPDMKLWQEIIFLKKFSQVPFVVENVKPYYPVFIEAQEIGRHLFWTNFDISGYNGKFLSVGRFGPVKSSPTGRTDVKDKIKRNCVEPEMGLHIFNSAYKEPKQKLLSVSPTSQTSSNGDFSKEKEHNISLKESSSEDSQISSNDETSLNNNIRRNKASRLQAGCNN